MIRNAAVLVLAAAVLSIPGFAQQAGQAAAVPETESRVADLEAFHDIIYPMWHTAYPEKDLEALKGFVPRIRELAPRIYQAPLPGILRDKEAKWTAGVAEFKAAVEAYEQAAAGADGQALLDAAEALHAKYEALVRSIRPVLKEMDDFHKVLYVVFHRLLPEKKWADIRAAAPDLALKAEAVTGAKLSARLESRAADFQAAAGELRRACQALAAAAKGADDAALEPAVLAVHAKYQALEQIFN